MSTVGSILLDQQILLESGTNELELLVFRVADYTFGINVAKVREVLTLQPITRLAKAHPSVRGVFKLRNRVIPCVSLVDHLGLAPRSENDPPAEYDGERTMILTDFNQQQTAFLVDHVERIHRLSWEQILNVPPLMALGHSPLTAVARCNERLVVLLDFEMIIDQVTGFELDAKQAPNPHGVPRDTKRIIVADDSTTVREAMAKTLQTSGYTQVATFSNGADAWREIQTRYKQRRQVSDVADLLISDVEMPQMDGLHLTRCVKEHPELRQIPVMLYSSLVTPDNFKKGKAVGADAQVSKPQLNNVVNLADELIRGVRDEFSTLTQNGKQREPAPVAAPAVIPRAPVSAPAPATEFTPDAKPTSFGGTATATATVTASTTSVEFDRVDRQLWRTFMQELQSHVVRLSDLATLIDEGTIDAPGLQEFGRTLHSIKGAATVVPLETVARATHLLESLLEPLRSTPAPWSSAPMFERYVDWIGDLCSPQSDPRTTLARGTELECDLALALSKCAE
jgi:two-component system chemotaxis response regulator CheV